MLSVLGWSATHRLLPRRWWWERLWLSPFVINEHGRVKLVCWLLLPEISFLEKKKKKALSYGVPSGFFSLITLKASISFPGWPGTGGTRMEATSCLCEAKPHHRYLPTHSCSILQSRVWDENSSSFTVISPRQSTEGTGLHQESTLSSV